MKTDSKIYIAGHTGMVGSAIVRKLKSAGFNNLVLKTRKDLDLLSQTDVQAFFDANRPEYVILSAARVGGIKANLTYPADFLFENLQIQNNIIWSAHSMGVKKLLFLGSSCIYPRSCPQPMKEEYLLDGKVEPTNEGYALAKIAGIKLCEKINEQFNENFISCMPTNIYGYNDNFNLESSHVIPALLRRMQEAKDSNANEVVIWGSGETRREFLFVDDLAEAIYWLMLNYNERQFLNIGTGQDVSIKELAFLIKDIVGYQGQLVFDITKPDGMPRKLLDVTNTSSLGWKYETQLKKGIELTYEWFLKNAYGK
ncbi:MAG: GDP-L-fucose synthase [bacterium]